MKIKGYKRIIKIFISFDVILIIASLSSFIVAMFNPYQLNVMFSLILAISTLFWIFLNVDILIPRIKHRIYLKEKARMPYTNIARIMNSYFGSDFIPEIMGTIPSGRLNVPDNNSLTTETLAHTLPSDLLNYDVTPKSTPLKEFKINEYITVKLEGVETNIYVNGEIFKQCKYLLLNIPKNKVSEYDSINSVDDIAQGLNRDFEIRASEIREKENITPEIEFFAHCSNLQTWCEYGYDTRILHSNLSFPLLKRLTEIGDKNAISVFREEIAKRFEDGNENVRRFLNEENYLGYLSIDEILLVARNVFEKEGRIEIKAEDYKKKVDDNDYYHTLF